MDDRQDGFAGIMPTPRVWPDVGKHSPPKFPEWSRDKGVYEVGGNLPGRYRWLFCTRTDGLIVDWAFVAPGGDFFAAKMALFDSLKADEETGGTDSSTQAKSESSDTLEFLGEHTWSSGSPFWLWRFLTDYEPLDAEKGQILRQDSGDWYVYPRGCDDHRWVSPELACRVVREWLDVQPGGTDYEGSGEVPEVESADVTRATGRAYFSELNREGSIFGSEDWKRYGGGAVLCRRPIPEIGADKGDVLVFAHHPDIEPKAVYGRAIKLGVEDFQALRSIIPPSHGRDSTHCVTGKEKVQALFANICDPESDPRYWPVISFLHNKSAWGKQMKVFYSRLRLVKPWVNYRSMSDPIIAASDEGAIWELLRDAGCALPHGGSDD